MGPITGVPLPQSCCGLSWGASKRVKACAEGRYHCWVTVFCCFVRAHWGQRRGGAWTSLLFLSVFEKRVPSVFSLSLLHTHVHTHTHQGPRLGHRSPVVTPALSLLIGQGGAAFTSFSNYWAPPSFPLQEPLVLKGFLFQNV